MSKRKWILGTTVALLVLAGGIALYASTKYDPLLFVVNGKAVRYAEWKQDVMPELFNGVTYTRNEEIDALKQRSMEELILYKAEQAGVKADEAQVEKQFSENIGKTPDEQAKKLKEMNVTADEVKSNYRRAMTGFAMKSKMTAGIKVSDQEVSDYYKQNKALYDAPEFRSTYFLKAPKDNAEVNELMKTATDQSFPDITKTYNSSTDPNLLSGWHELIGESHLADHTSAKAAKFAFQSPAKKLVGPFADGDENYWFEVSEIKPEYQFTLMEVSDKIRTTLLQDKQVNAYRQWVEQQKADAGYYYDPDNLNRSSWDAFWHDLPENWKVLF